MKRLRYTVLPGVGTGEFPEEGTVADLLFAIALGRLRSGQHQLALASLYLAIAIPIIKWWLGRRRKRLSYRVVSAGPLVSFHAADELRGRLVITFDGQTAPTLDIHAVVVKIWNSGNQPINDTDVKPHGAQGDSCAFLTYGECATVLTDGEIRDQPRYANATAPRDQSNPRQLLLQPVLLNKGESLTIRTQVRAYGGFRIEGRILGGDIREAQERPTVWWAGYEAATWAVLNIALLAIVKRRRNHRRPLGQAVARGQVLYKEEGPDRLIGRTSDG